MRVHSLGYRCLHSVQYPKFIITMAERVLDSYDRVYLLGREDPYFLRGYSWTLWADYRYLCAWLHHWLQSAEDRNSTSFIIQFTCNKVRFDHFCFSMIWSLSVFICVYFWISALRTSLSSLPQFKAFKATYVKLLILWPNESGSCYAIKMSFSIWHHHI